MDSVGCVETSLSEPSKAGDTVIKAVLKGAFHWLIEAAGAVVFALSLSKEPHTQTHSYSQAQPQTYRPTVTQPKRSQEGRHSFSAILRHKSLFYYSGRHPHLCWLVFSQSSGI